jgi:hypothetical protein
VTVVDRDLHVTFQGISDEAKAAVEGSHAGAAGAPLSDCPHRPGSPEWSEWQKGWIAGRLPGAEGATADEKAALGLAATPTMVGAGPSSAALAWFVPTTSGSPLGASLAGVVSAFNTAADILAAAATRAAADFEKSLRTFHGQLSFTLDPVAYERLCDALDITPAGDDLPADPKARALAVKQRRANRPCPKHGPTSGGLCRACTRR